MDCSVKHFVQDCLANLESKEKETLNFIEVLDPLILSSFEAKPIIPLQIITKAYAKDQEKENQGETQIEKSSNTRKSWHNRKNRRNEKMQAKEAP